MNANGSEQVVKRFADLPAAMRDGTVLRADVYGPSSGGQLPVVLIRTPYRKTRHGFVDLASEIAARGYLVVVQDMRGRYASEGDFDPFFSPTTGKYEASDGYDTVEWAAALPGSTGAVGTLGWSYGSRVQWQLAPTRPPHLRAMFAGGHGPDTRLVWPGIFTRDRQLQWLFNLMVPDTRRRLGLPGPTSIEEAQRLWDTIERGKWLWFTPMAEFPDYILGGFREVWHYWLSHHHCNWYSRDVVFSEIDVPAYHVTGWYDRLWSTVDMFTRMVKEGRTARTRSSQRLIVGPWTHGFNLTRRLGIMDFGEEAGFPCAELAARWFDYWLKGIDTDIVDEPPVRVFTMGANRWHFENEWPPARARLIDFYCHSGGRANTPAGDGVLSPQAPGDEPRDAFLYDPRDPVMSLHQPDGQAAPSDLREHDCRQDILVYQTPVLEGDLEVTGEITCCLFAASSARDTDWTVRLVDVHPDGLAVNLSYGIVRARYRDSWSNPSLLEPGRVYEYRLRLVPTSNLFKAGHRIRVDISSSDFPNYDRNHNTGQDYWIDSAFVTARQAVFHDAEHPSRIILPVVLRG